MILREGRAYFDAKLMKNFGISSFFKCFYYKKNYLILCTATFVPASVTTAVRAAMLQRFNGCSFKKS